MKVQLLQKYIFIYISGQIVEVKNSNGTVQNAYVHISNDEKREGAGDSSSQQNIQERAATADSDDSDPFYDT